MTTTLHITIPLEPVTASRARYSSKSRRAYHSPKYEAYLKTVTAMIRAMTQGRDQMTGPVEIAVEFIRARPKKPANPYPVGDFDNLAKAIADAITQAETVWVDDKQVVICSIMKAYAEPGEQPHTNITVRELDGGYRRCWPGKDAVRALTPA